MNSATAWSATKERARTRAAEGDPHQRWERWCRALELLSHAASDPVAAVTAPTPWWKKTNPATGKPYTSVEEYDRVPRHPDQTCKNSRLDELEAEKKLLMKLVPPYDPKAPRSKNVEKLDKVPCSRIRLRLESMKRVLEKRWEIEKECFGGKPENIKKLEARNCAPGHPMAEK